LACRPQLAALQENEHGRVLFLKDALLRLHSAVDGMLEHLRSPQGPVTACTRALSTLTAGTDCAAFIAAMRSRPGLAGLYRNSSDTPNGDTPNGDASNGAPTAAEQRDSPSSQSDVPVLLLDGLERSLAAAGEAGSREAVEGLKQWSSETARALQAVCNVLGDAAAAEEAYSK
jgi:hypothetical protein